MKRVAIVGWHERRTLTAEGLAKFPRRKFCWARPVCWRSLRIWASPPSGVHTAGSREFWRGSVAGASACVSGDVGFYSAAEGLLAAFPVMKPRWFRAFPP
jgi:hypothetical protein